MTKPRPIDAILDPAHFQRAILKRKLWAVQKAIVRAANTKRSTSVKGCHASGKTYAITGAVLHHLQRYPQGKVITIAPTMRQVKLMWEEIELARRQALIAFPACTITGIRISEDRYGIGFSSARGVNAQGFHGSDLLIIADESPGIPQDIWDAIEGIRAGGRVRMVKLGNPTVPSGPFYDDFGRARSQTECITISAFDTPNLFNEAAQRPYTIEELLAMDDDEIEAAPVPFLITRQWVREKYLRWGPTNPRYLSRVLGQFPTHAENSVFNLEWIERAHREPTDLELRRSKLADGAMIQIGIDVAGPGSDETAGCARVNGIILARAAWADADPRAAVINWIHGIYKSFPQYRRGPVVVDMIGIGYNFGLHLADHGLSVAGFNASRAAIDTEQFANAKAEAYFRMREMYREDYISHLPEALDDETEAQLAGAQYEENTRGQVQIESKEDAKKRGVESPDRAEAQIMAFARVQLRSLTMQFGDVHQYEISPV